jgi:hypothetical protein
MKPEETRLQAVRDDGRITYLAFEAAGPAGLALFDQDGRPLATASAGRVVAVGGLHRGILVKQGDRASYVSPNPRRPASPRSLPPEDPEHAEARAKLENHGGLLQAMQRALAAAAPSLPQSGAPAAAAAALAERIEAARPMAPVAGMSFGAQLSARAGIQELPQVTYLDAQPDPEARPARWPGARGRTVLPVPLEAAHASAAVPEHGLVRVFFATASRTIVAPDDGLGMLLREAPNADEIRVTGFTDATGARETNEALARARADAVVQILLRRGVSPARIFSSGIGAADYIADNASEKGRALNRRVEVVLLREGRPLEFSPSVKPLRQAR